MIQSLSLGILFSISSWAMKPDLRPGDVLLISLQCPICQTIEAEEKGPYSHAGVVSIEADQKIKIMEAITDPITEVTLGKFLSRRREGTSVLVLRAKNTHISESSLLKRFNEKFLNHHYDAEFLWDDRDSLGEKYYCSELVAKLLLPYLPEPIPTKPMHYQTDRKAWIEFFNGANPPDGKPGISPADLARSPLFEVIGQL